MSHHQQNRTPREELPSARTQQYLGASGGYGGSRNSGGDSSARTPQPSARQQYLGPSQNHQSAYSPQYGGGGGGERSARREADNPQPSARTRHYTGEDGPHGGGGGRSPHRGGPPQLSARGDYPPPSARTQQYLGPPQGHGGRGGGGSSARGDRPALSPRAQHLGDGGPMMSSRSRSNPPAPEVGGGAAGRYGAITPRTMRNRQRAYNSDGEGGQHQLHPQGNGGMSGGPTPRVNAGAGGPTPRVYAGAGGPTPRMNAGGPTPRLLGSPGRGHQHGPNAMLSARPGDRHGGPSPRPSARSPQGSMSARPHDQRDGSPRANASQDAYSGRFNFGGSSSNPQRWESYLPSARGGPSSPSLTSPHGKKDTGHQNFGNFGMQSENRVALPPSTTYAPPYSRDDLKMWEGTNNWTALCVCAPCEMPVFCMSACCLPWLCVYKQRKVLLNHRMIDYECCAGVCGRYHTEGCNKYTRGNEEFCLALEVALCLGCAIHGNRWMVQQYYNLQNDIADSCVMLLSYLLLPLSFLMQDDALENIADVAYLPCASCLITQVHHHVKVFGFTGFKPQEME